MTTVLPVVQKKVLPERSAMGKGAFTSSGRMPGQATNAGESTAAGSCSQVFKGCRAWTILIGVSCIPIGKSAKADWPDI